MALRHSLRVLTIAPTGFFADYGCHVRIRGQMAALIARGHRVHIVTYPGGRDVDGLPTVRPPWWPSRRPMPVGSSRRKLVLDALLAPVALSAAWRLPDGPPHVIHAYLHEGALIGSWLAGLLRRPLVFDFQGSLTAEMLDHRFLHPRSPLLPILRRLERWIDHQPQAILASSQLAADLLVRAFDVPAALVRTLPDSVDSSVFRPRSQLPAARLMGLRRKLNLPADSPVLVYLGLLAPYQGTELLLEALSLLAARRVSLHCLLMGFPDVDRYRTLAQHLGIAERVTFTGAVPYEQAPYYLALGDVAVAPKLSATEGSGKLLTYMAAALPVIASDTPVHREYLGDYGIYAPAGDAAGLAQVIEDTLPCLDSLGSLARGLRERASARYSWDHAAAQIEEVYRSLVMPRRGAIVLQD